MVRRRAKNAKASSPQTSRIDRTPPWTVVYFRASDGSVPALDFLDKCPGKVDAEFMAVLDAVAAAPPPQFSGGGKWEAMHGTMGGWHEIRLTGPSREQFRLFCLLENAGDEAALRTWGIDVMAVDLDKDVRAGLRAAQARQVMVNPPST